MRFQPPRLRQRAKPDYCRPARRPSTTLYLRLQRGGMNSRSATATAEDLSSRMPAWRGGPSAWSRIQRCDARDTASFLGAVSHWSYQAAFAWVRVPFLFDAMFILTCWYEHREKLRSFLKLRLGQSFGVKKKHIKKKDHQQAQRKDCYDIDWHWYCLGGKKDMNEKTAVSCSVVAEILSVSFLDVCEPHRAEITPPAFSWTNISVDVTGNRLPLLPVRAHFLPVHSHSVIHYSSLKSVLRALLQVCVGVFRPAAIWWPRMKSNFSWSATCWLSFTPSLQCKSALHFRCLRIPSVHFQIF